MCYDELEQGKTKDIGESLYLEHFYYCNTSELLRSENQTILKKYSYCKSFSCPPFPSLQETPASIIDDFTLIEGEYNKHRAYQRKNKQGKR